MRHALGDLLYPGRCLACRRFFRIERPGCLQAGRIVSSDANKVDSRCGYRSAAHEFDRIAAPFLCRECRSVLMPAEAPFCTCCGYVFESRQGESRLCRECTAHPKPFVRARAFGVYTGGLKALIQAFKYAAKPQLARPLGQLLLIACYRHGWQAGIDLVVPVPLHRRRLRQRGFNQSALPLAHWPGMVRQWGLPMVGRIATGVIERHRFTEPQASIGRKDRLTNIKQAFRVVDPDRIEGRRILLVDDVYTTGATVNECARVLMQGGAAEVRVLTIARAL